MKIGDRELLAANSVHLVGSINPADPTKQITTLIPDGVLFVALDDVVGVRIVENVPGPWPIARIWLSHGHATFVVIDDSPLVVQAGIFSEYRTRTNDATRRKAVEGSIETALNRLGLPVEPVVSGAAS